MRKKRENPEDFIGWKSEDGLLEVVELLEKSKHSKFKVICHKCKEDVELFPQGYFVRQKSDLVKGAKPCGCAKYRKWNEYEYLILAKRASTGRFIVHGFSEEFHGQRTKLSLGCLKDGYEWTTSVNNVVNRDTGCPKCAGNYKPTEQEALDKCKQICETEGYKLIGFVNGYKNANSRFEYKCPVHGKQNVEYGSFVNGGTRCKGCWKEIGNGNGYYLDRKDEQDFLYILDFDSQFIKVGRSFDIDKRIIGLRSKSKIKKIHKLRIFTATHQEIYDLEQELHSELRERGFQYYLDWTNECFENDCLFILNKLLDICYCEEIFREKA